MEQSVNAVFLFDTVGFLFLLDLLGQLLDYQEYQTAQGHPCIIKLMSFPILFNGPGLHPLSC